MKKLIILLAIIVPVLSVPFAHAGTTKEKFDFPSIRDDFCGEKISPYWCQCAFHGEASACQAQNTDEERANDHLFAEYKKWLTARIESFVKKCRQGGGDWFSRTYTCTYNDTSSEESRTEGVAERYNLIDPDIDKPKKNEFAGQIHSVKGEVFVYSAAFQKWIGPVSGGHSVYFEDLVITTEGGSAQIIAYDVGSLTNTIDLAPNSRIRFFSANAIKAANEAPPSWIGLLQKGAAFVRELAESIGKEKKRVPMWIHTTNIVVGSRGTEFVVTHDENSGVSEAYLLEGIIDIAPFDEGKEISFEGEDAHALNPGDFYSSESDEVTAEAAFDLNSYGFSEEAPVISDEDLIVPSGPPVDPDLEDIVGDLDSVIEEQIAGKGSGGGGFVIILVLIAAGFGLWFWKKKKS